MPRAESSSESSRNDWLPWSLAVFGAGCAVFVLWKGVLPAQSANAHLVEQVARLESAAQAASSEVESLEESKGQLLQQYTTAQAQLASSGKQSERERETHETIRREMNLTFAALIAAGDLWLEQRPGEGTEQLVIGVGDQLLFNGARGDVTRQGRQLLKALAENLKHLPSDQVYEIGGHFDPEAASDDAGDEGKTSEDKTRGKPRKGRPRPAWELSARRAANVARYLEEDGIAGTQLVAAGFSRHHPAAAPEKNGRIEIVLRGPSPKQP
jgi:chemotaxis protein MotB